MASSLPIAFKSQRVCAACRKGKKQCDKAIPRCSRCIRKSFCCDYTAPADNLSLFRPDIAQINDIPLISTDSCLPTLTEFGWNNLLRIVCSPSKTDRKTSELCILIRRILKASDTSLADIEIKFRNTIYHWFPIIDPTTLIRQIEFPAHEATNDTSAIILLCMYILTQKPCEHETHMASNSLYLVARRLFYLIQDLESESPVELLQIGILITLYECSHAIWNAAYLSLANCIALSQVAGLHYADSLDTPGNTPAQACGWAVMLLDRLMSLLNSDNSRLSFIPYKGSQHNMHLPSWLQGPIALQKARHNSPEFFKLYATAETSYHLEYAIQYTSLIRKGLDTSLSFEAIHSSTLQLTCKLLSMSQSQALYLCNTTAFTLSVLVSLCIVRYLRNPRGGQAELKTTMSLHSVSNMVLDMIHTTTEMTVDTQIEDVSFIGLVTVLHAATHLIGVKGQHLDIEDMDEIESLLLRFSKRWTIGAQFLREFKKHKSTTWPKITG
ncbi:hypothetical protein F4678DRAFT_447194 [Xylaria arbuscula]|nr:hypothetical protein F4678DRAFT_447194 [Xylaria arbuscula]